MRRLMLALSLVIVAATSNACGRTPTSTREERPLSAFEPFLTRQLTPALARAQFGAPDELAGSGLLIYKYRLEGEQTLWLGFPGFAPIIYANLEAKDGTMRALELR